ncbi:MAG: hypothetical protein RI988_4123 [Pseudomonadota bacterium]|jgi:hypothetical protein
MQVWLRLLTVCFVAIALPVQCIAGVTMAHCGTSHERLGAAMEAAQHRHAASHTGAAHPHDIDARDDAVPAVEVDQASAAPATAQAGKLTDRAPYKCSSCSLCCAGSALPSAAPRLPEAPAEAAAFAELIVTVGAFASNGPDRPPRSHLL